MQLDVFVVVFFVREFGYFLLRLSCALKLSAGSVG